MRPNFTLNYGVRWSTSTPVYEQNGLQVVPNVNLTDYFNQRVASSNAVCHLPIQSLSFWAARPITPPAITNRTGTTLRRQFPLPGRLNSGNSFGKVFGREGKSVIRGGFRMTYDRIGSQLAVNFDLNNLAGFTSARNINANTFDVIPGRTRTIVHRLQSERSHACLPGSTGPIPTSFAISR